jgi:hypothetical protein
MALFRCRSCGKAGTWVYDPERYTCPICDSIDAQFEISREELPDDDPGAQKMDELAEEAETKRSRT